MLSQANPLKGANSLDLYIKKIHSVFEMHTIVYGSPEDLPPFVNSLRKNRHLAMDFWALTAAIQRHGGDELSNEKLLDIITQAVTRKDTADVRETGEEQKQAIDNLSRLLAGEDIDNPLSQPEEPWPPKRAEETVKKERPVSVFSRIETVLPAKPEPAPEGPIVESAVEQASAPDTESSSTPQQKAEKKQPPVNVASRIETLSPAREEPAPEDPVVEHAVEEAATLKAETSPASQETAATQPRSEVVMPAEDEAASQNQAVESVVEGTSTPEAETAATSGEDAVRAGALWQNETDLKDDLPSAASPTLSKHALDEALQRLELSSRQLKRHLTQIDHRMSRLEPHLRELASKIASQPDEEIDPVLTYPPRESDLSFDAMAHRKPDQKPRTANTKPRLVLKEEVDESSGAVPFENYYAERNRGLGTAGWFALLVLLAGSVFAARHWHSRQQFASGLQQTLQHTNAQITGEAYTAWDRLKKVFSPASAPNGTNSTNSGSLPSRAATEDSASQTTSTNNQPAAENTSGGESPTNSATASSEPAPSGLTVSNARETVPVRPNRPLLDDGEYTSARASLDSEMPVNVPASVMQDNLITSRVPAYPEAAKADGVEGPVVMQALISKNGTVDRLHVIQGDPLLRGAASQAVSKWQYRPYTVNGHPVEVATTVRVDFRLPRR